MSDAAVTALDPAVRDGLPAELLADLRSALGPGPLRTRLLDRLRYGHDASHFLLRPSAVVIARDSRDVQATVATAARHGIPVTFRSGGTSLSGQAGTDGILLDTRRGFRRVEALDGGARVRCQPGATVRAVNTRLAPYGRSLGPDPASEFACTIGGVVANNSSGMQCGTTANSYRTLDALDVLLPSGTRIDTGQSDADERLRHDEPELWEGLARLRDRVRGNPDSVRRITHQFSMKNTMGYGLNALLDYDDPADILAHLMVGSEGTLGFILSATFRTVPVYPQVATSLLIFDTIEAATQGLPEVIAAGSRTAELMDAASLRTATDSQLPVPGLTGLAVGEHTALLVEAQEERAEELRSAQDTLERAVRGLVGLSAPAIFTQDAAERAALWSVRKGLHTAVAARRRPGTTALLEDIVVPMPALTSTVRELRGLCDRFGYSDAVIFGHARDANLHFLLTPDFADDTQVRAFADFTEELVDLVLGADGSLKAEHGTGRIMAPYVRRQYGDELYEVMCRIKDLADPGHTLNPGVIISDDPQVHLRHLKPAPPVDPAVDACVECGYCEPVCPSRDLTTTPRQRIALLREIAIATPRQRRELQSGYGYAAVDTCAADSLCHAACPVGIDTGAVMKQRRVNRQTPATQAAGRALARRWEQVLPALRAGVDANNTLPSGAGAAATRALRRLLPTDLVPFVAEDTPGPGISRRTGSRRAPGEVVLFASCIQELFGPAEGRGLGAARAFLALCDRVGVAVHIPPGVDGLCCGTIWRSKGLTEGAAEMARRTLTVLLEAAPAGTPIVTDSSSCSRGLRELAGDLRAAAQREDDPSAAADLDLARRADRLVVLDAVAYIAQHILPRLPAVADPAMHEERTIVVHPTCSDRRSGDVDALLAVAGRRAGRVIVPADAGCCGFAGDRGMLHPELTASATRAEALDIAALGSDVFAYVSSNRTCELGMTRATGRTYRHILEVLEEATR